jgi:outer membrane protein TolC
MCIRIGLENARIVRVLAGVTAQSSGRTMYDAGIVNTTIDQEQARFDPTVEQRNTWDRLETPTAIFDPTDPLRALLIGPHVYDYTSEVRLGKTNVLGGQWLLRWVENPSRFIPTGPFDGAFPLNPQTRSTLELSYTQPLLQGAGFAFNTAPIVLARLNTEQSFFQYKDSTQELVRGIIEAYWNLVQARTEVWARQIQVETSEEAYLREKARLKSGFADLSNVAQARVTYNQFRANLIAARANVLAREGALRNLLGLPPSDGKEIVPSSAPTSKRFSPDWDKVLRLAEERRPDVVEQKIILEADRVRLLQAENQTLPKLDFTTLYRWNGLSGRMPNGESLSTGPGQFTDWTVGLNFSVPLGLRQGRAQIRQQTLIIERDQENLKQTLHNAAHTLAVVTRDLANSYEQFLAYRETRSAALDNLRVQIEQFRAQRTIYLNVLQALSDWGNAVLSETQSLTNYNVALASLEQQTGTILESHGLYFYEERLKAAGPLGGHFPVDYLGALPAKGMPSRYPSTGEPGENAFDLRKPDLRGSKPPERAEPRGIPDQLPLPRRFPGEG